METTRREKFLALLFYALALVMAGIVLRMANDSFQDDAYISLRYVRHLLEGEGLTWNAGERVEGYTNFLFIILTAALAKLGFNFVTATKIINLAAYGAMLWVLAAYVKRRRPEQTPIASALAFHLVAASLPILFWCMQGLESVLFACFVLCAVISTFAVIERRHGYYSALSGLLLALAFMTRPDGLVFAGGISIFLLFLSWRRELPLRELFIMTGTLAIMIVPYMIWRHAYFGDWLPNTYYAKTYGIPPLVKWRFGLQYALLFLCMPPLLLLYAVAIWGGLYVKHRSLMERSIQLLGWLVLLFVAYVIEVGGDSKNSFRFFVPLIPLLALLIYHGMLHFLTAGKQKLVRDIWISLLCFSVLQLGLVEDWPYPLGALSGLAVAPYVNTHWPKHSVIALDTVGALPYVADDYRYIDMLGLTDKHIGQEKLHALRAPGQSASGHLKGDGKYVLSRQPDYILFDLAWGDDQPFYLSDLEITEQPEFQRDYKKMEIYIDPPAELIPQLRVLAAQRDNNHLVMNDKDQVLFTYFERISK